MTEQQTAAIADLKRAVEFFDKVQVASDAERIAVGSDHWDWIKSAAKNVAANF